MSTERGQSQRLQVIVETIVQVARPERVILFGSRVKGTARDESDYISHHCRTARGYHGWLTMGDFAVGQDGR